jgi:hypothetical protein
MRLAAAYARSSAAAAWARKPDRGPGGSSSGQAPIDAQPASERAGGRIADVFPHRPTARAGHVGGPGTGRAVEIDARKGRMDGDHALNRVLVDQARQQGGFGLGQRMRTRIVAGAEFPAEVARREVPVQVDIAGGVLQSSGQSIRVQRRDHHQPRRRLRLRDGREPLEERVDARRFISVDAPEHHEPG